MPPVFHRPAASVGRGVRLAVLGLLALTLGSCTAALPTEPSDAGAAGNSDDVAYCASELNRYRATRGLPPLARAADLEEYAARAAEVDGAAHVAHLYFAATNGGSTSRAETEICWWTGGTARTVIRLGLAQMWQVGPGGEHYDIIAGPFTEVGCGVYISGGEVTVAQDFR